LAFIRGLKILKLAVFGTDPNAAYFSPFEEKNLFDKGCTVDLVRALWRKTYPRTPPPGNRRLRLLPLCSWRSATVQEALPRGAFPPKCVTKPELRYEGVKGGVGKYRLRVGNRRVLFALEKDIIFVYAVRDRKEADE